MRRRPACPWWCAAVVGATVCALIGARAPAAEGWLLAGDGRSSSGPVSLADAADVHVGALTCALTRIVSLRLAPPIATQIDAGVVLVDGSILRGVPERIEGDTLTIRTDLGGAQRIPTSTVAALILAPTPIALCTQGLGGSGVRFANGEGVDGPLAYVNTREIGVTVGRRIRRVPRDRITRVLVHGVAPTPGLDIALTTGDRLHGTIAGITGERVTIAGAGLRVELPLTAIRDAWSVDPGCLALERLAFTEQDQPAVEAIHPAQAAPLPPSPAWPDGLERGMRIDAGATVTTTAVAGWNALVGEVACARTGGPVSCTVLVDGHPAATTGSLAPGGPGQVVHVTLSGAHTLAIRVTGDAAGAPGTAVWIAPTLVR